jgi:hypothetical protein
MERLDALICELDRLDDGLERSLQARGDTPAVDDGSGQAVD